MKLRYLIFSGRCGVGILIMTAVNLFTSFASAQAQAPAGSDSSEMSMVFAEEDTVSMQVGDTTETGFSLNENEIKKASPLRFGVRYESALKFVKPVQMRMNRFSFRLEYSKSLSNHFSLQVDSKIFAFMGGDHRARSTTYWINDSPEKADLAFGGRTREAYLQGSFNRTSVKLGIQTLAWGESDFANITNEVSPLDFREPLNLNIDELRLNQFVLTVDQYSPFGEWSAFFTPFPRINQHAKKGTGYYYDPFNDAIAYQLEKPDHHLFEYGGRWKKTFGRSDVSVMAARLVNNEYAMQLVAPDLITQSKFQYTITGATFNYAIKNFLLKGEVAVKFPKAYNDAALQIVKKKNLDATFGIDYSINSTSTISVEAVNYHIIGWNEELAGTPKDNYMLLFIMSKQLKNNNLSVNWVTMYNGPYSNFFNLLTTSYNWNDHITLYFDALLPITDEPRSGLYIYRNQKQVAFKIQYQF